eukprot:scaffold140_cov247-Pinguiococcus_pyrenoidosus.AAC.7
MRQTTGGTREPHAYDACTVRVEIVAGHAERFKAGGLHSRCADEVVGQRQRRQRAKLADGRRQVLLDTEVIDVAVYQGQTSQRHQRLHNCGCDGFGAPAAQSEAREIQLGQGGDADSPKLGISQCSLVRVQHGLGFLLNLGVSLGFGCGALLSRGFFSVSCLVMVGHDAVLGVAVLAQIMLCVSEALASLLHDPKADLLRRLGNEPRCPADGDETLESDTLRL